MRYQDFARAAAGVLATGLLATGAALAQSQPATMTDTAMTPASDRSSLGAVIMMDQPVLAQREMMLQAQERSAVDTRSMGAGAAKIMRGMLMKEERAQDTIERQKVTPK